MVAASDKRDLSDRCCNRGVTFPPYTLYQAILEDNLKSYAPLASAGVLGCLLASCAQIREATPPRPPASTYQVGPFQLPESGSLQQVRGASVTPIFFQSAKVSTLFGRGFLAEEYDSGGQHVVMLSHRLWQQRFGGDPRIIGAPCA